MRTPKAINACAEAMRRFLILGWKESDLDYLEALWWLNYDERREKEVMRNDELHLWHDRLLSNLPDPLAAETHGGRGSRGKNETHATTRIKPSIASY